MLESVFRDKKSMSYLAAFLALLGAALFILFSIGNFASGTSGYSNANASIMLYDQEDPEGGSMTFYTWNTTASNYTTCGAEEGVWTKSNAKTKPYFYVNFTNATTNQIITDGNCSIRFNATGGDYTYWENMSYNSTAKLYVYNRSFTAKAVRDWEVYCVGNVEGNINASDNITITNSPPNIFCRELGPNGPLPMSNCTEDIPCIYNFAANVSDDDLNDILIYSATNTFPGFSINSSNGTVIIDVLNDSSCGAFNLTLTVTDSGASPNSVPKIFNVTPVNDPPVFTNLNLTMYVNQDALFLQDIDATDEENNIPFFFNVSFVNCTLANWSTRTDCNLFSINYSTGVINFTPYNNDVGNYTVNFTVTDAGSPSQTPVNATNSTIVIFSVLNVNDKPNLTYVCDNEKNSTENSNFACWITANDTDESYNLTFYSNMSLFTFNNSKNSQTESVTENTTVQFNFTANDSMVGAWHINISVVDSMGGTASTQLSFNVTNVNDPVSLWNVNASYSAYAYAEFYLSMNGSDDDLRIPSQGKVCDIGCYNESLTFTRTITGPNSTLFNVIKNFTATNTTYSYIKFTPTNADSGDYSINITLTDANSFSIDSINFTMTIYNNSIPYWVNLTQTSFNIDDNSTFTMNLSVNATDDDGDSITFSDNSPIIAITPTGSITFFANDSIVGTHNATITLTDSRGSYNSSQNFTFIISNINETPVLYAVSNYTLDEDVLLTVNFSSNDEDLDLPGSSETLLWDINSTTPWFTDSKLNFSIANNKSAGISFMPNKTDVGIHIINISITDSSGLVDSQEFNITVMSINHPPELDVLGSKNTTINQTYYLDINATDLEDGMDNVTGNLNFTFASNESWFNLTLNTGIVNVTLNSSHSGIHLINISVNDSSGSTDSQLLRLVVYSINLPPVIDTWLPFNLDVGTIENCTSFVLCNLSKTFVVNVTDPNAGEPNNDTLLIVWNIDGSANKTLTNATPCLPGNCPLWSWDFMTNFTDEGLHNITVNITDSGNITVSHSWNVTVNHSNAPVGFYGTIASINASQSSSVTVERNLVTGTIEGGGYFMDVDHNDPLYNHPINFTFTILDANCSNVTTVPATVNVSNETVIFYTASTLTSLFCMNITGYDYSDYSLRANSNYFQVNLTVTPAQTVPVPTPVGGGGGSETSKKVPIALKVIVPEPFSMFTHDRIVVPIVLQNKGQSNLNGVKVSAYSTLDGIYTELEKTSFDYLNVGQEEAFDLTIITNTNSTGSYEVIINATVDSPKYTDSAAFFVNLIEMGWKEKIKAQEKIVFLEELLIGNPECLELTELLTEAAEEFQAGNYDEALALAENAIQACKYAVSSRGRAVEVKRKFDFNTFVIIFTVALLALLFLLFILHSYQRTKFKKGS